MTTRNRTNAAAAPEPIDPNDTLLIGLDELIAVARAQRAKATPTASTKATAAPVLWTPATVQAAGALPVPIELPGRYPAKGPGAQAPNGPVFIGAPKDLSALDGPACPARRNDPLLAVIRAALLNDWHGHALHTGPSAADGGTLPLPVLFTVLATQPEQQKARRWSQTLASSGQTCIMAQLANVGGRFAICRPSGIVLVRDFYAAAT